MQPGWEPSGVFPSGATANRKGEHRLPSLLLSLLELRLACTLQIAGGPVPASSPSDGRTSQQVTTIRPWKPKNQRIFFFFLQCTELAKTKIKEKSKGTHLYKQCDNSEWKDSGKMLDAQIWVQQPSFGGAQSCCCGQGEAGVLLEGGSLLLPSRG